MAYSNFNCRQIIHLSGRLKYLRNWPSKPACRKINTRVIKSVCSLSKFYSSWRTFWVLPILRMIIFDVNLRSLSGCGAGRLGDLNYEELTWPVKGSFMRDLFSLYFVLGRDNEHISLNGTQIKIDCRYACYMNGLIVFFSWRWPNGELKRS